MKLINYIKKLDRTKRYVILFVLISFISIFSIGIYNSASTSKKHPQVETVSVVNKSKKKNSKNKKQKEKSVKTNDVSNTTNEVKNENNTNETNTNVNNGENKQESSQKNKSSSKKSNNTLSQNNNTPTAESNNNQVNQNPESPKKYINIQVKGVNSTWISKQINFDNSITAYDALKIACCDIGKEVHEKNSSYGGVYIEGIGDLYERDYGGTSGWKYKVNGTCPSVACSSYTLKEGDTLVWYYAMSIYE